MPKNSAWPKFTWPVNPASRSQLAAKIANIAVMVIMRST
jgi:hypothetical protein